MQTFNEKRVLNEVKKMRQDNTINLKEYNDGKCTFIINQNDVLEKIVTIDFNDSKYPFTCPTSIYVNNTNYKDLLQCSDNSILFNLT